MKRGDLRLVRIGMQTVVSVVLCEITHSLFNSALYLCEGRELRCDAQVICLDEASCSIMDWLIIGVYVEKSWGENFVYLNL